MNATLTFKRKLLTKKPSVCSGNRTYIDYMVDGVSLSKLLGGIHENIGKFGWKTNLDYENREFEDFQNAHSSQLINGMFSLYVCAECGDEGCGALMIHIETTNNSVIWKDFFWSDGSFGIEDCPSNKVALKPIVFDIEAYNKAMDTLKKMINET